MKCKTHGNLTLEQMVKKGKAGDRQLYRCKLCLKELHAKHYIKNKKKILKKNKLWVKKNPEKRKEVKKESYHKNKEKYREKLRAGYKRYNENNREKKAQFKRKMRGELYDSYVKYQLRRGTNLKPEDMPEAIIELKKTLIKIRRKLKEEKTSGKAKIKTKN